MWAVLNQIDLDAADKAEFFFCYSKSVIFEEGGKEGKKEGEGNQSVIMS